MKFLFTIILIVSFIGIAAFGFFGMYDMQNHDGNCAFETFRGTDCPKQVNPIDYFIFHIDAFKSFLIATFSNSFFTSLLLFALLMGVSFGILGGNLTHSKLSFSYYRHKPELFKSSSKHKLLRWLSLHENSPS